MKSKKALWLALGLAFGAALARADTLTFTCGPNISAATCNSLNTTIAAIYDSTFSNVSANIYIQYGTTGLGSNEGFTNQISYATYVADLAATASTDPVDSAVLATLPPTEPTLYHGAPIDITTALGTALGIPGLAGTTSGGSMCTIGTAGCYNGIITITNNPNTPLYYRVGVQNPRSFDFYTTVEHEVDEILGTGSCIETTGAGSTLVNGCIYNAASAVDLFRYNGAGDRVFISSTPGAHFSYDGGVTNGADGATYNTLANGDDYADFVKNCEHVQDAEGCWGVGGLNITNDGGAEINILDAIGYNLNTDPDPVPEPRALFLLVPVLLAAVHIARRFRLAG